MYVVLPMLKIVGEPKVMVLPETSRMMAVPLPELKLSR